MGAGAHQSGCHSAYRCPSDHHSYVWYDGSGAGFDCVKPGAPEYNPASDTSTIVYGGLTYYCRPIGGSLPPPPPPPPRVALCHVSGPYPDKHCTPGALFTAITATQVCRPGYSNRVRRVSQATKDRVFARYGIAVHDGSTYEVDHFIPLELGGSNTLSNLFPEAASPVPGFHQKDKLENALHRRVCNASMTIEAAQAAIRKNWIAAYKRYVHAN